MIYYRDQGSFWVLLHLLVALQHLWVPWRVISFPCRILLLHLWQKRTLYFIRRTTQSSSEKRSNSFNLEDAGRAGESLTVFAIIQNFRFLLIIAAICFVTGSFRQVNFHVVIVLRAGFVLKLLDKDSILSINLPCFERSVSDVFLLLFSPHPYLFFNQDHITMTFLGFFINSVGDLADPQTSQILEKGLMSKPLRNGLQAQRVDFATNIETSKK